MKRIRSISLFNYLVECNIDFNDTEAIALAKQNYRKKYKREWKKKAQRHREVRPLFTHYEYSELCKRAYLLDLKPTTYVRAVVLSAQENHDLIPDKPQLLEVLQRISMAVNQDRNNTLLIEAEELLLSYLKNH